MQEPEKEDAGPVSPPNDNSKRHIMFSYSWADKDRVLKLQTLLLAFGFDVWRDETGSSLLPAMVGHTDDMMTKAVARSSHVVIFVRFVLCAVLAVVVF